VTAAAPDARGELLWIGRRLAQGRHGEMRVSAVFAAAHRAMNSRLLF
jgi:hypothetical protein